MQVAAASANVRTLYPSEERAAAIKVAGELLLGKVQLLEKQFDLEELAIVGIQEGRGTATAQRDGLNYQMFTSAACAQGLGGCQVRNAKWLGFRVHACERLSPRLMYVTGVTRKLECKLQVLSAHAPCEDAGQNEKDLFWDELL
jgi:hypothetical protein